jgi:hypothetical protein
MHLCNNCSFSASNLQEYIKHQYKHKFDKNCSFRCTFCISNLKSFDALKSHIKRFHKETQELPISKDLFSCICPYDLCQFSCPDFETIRSHLYIHFEKTKVLICPHNGCHKHFSSKNSFNVHLFRVHRTKKEIFFPESDFLPSTSSTSLILHEEPVHVPIPNPVESGHSLIPFVQKLKAQHFASEKLIQNVVDEILHIDENIKSTIKEKIDFICRQQNTENLRSLLEEVFADVGCLKKDEIPKIKNAYCRKKMYKSGSHYVKSVPVLIGRDKKHRKCHYQYIPIEKTIKTFCNDPSVIFSKSPQNNPSILKDYSDGSNFTETCNSDIEIILYQDAFEVCIIVGSAKKKYKMIGVYIAFAQVSQYHRYLVDNIQLVLLCRQIHMKRFGLSKIFERTVTDLKILENDGILVKGQRKNVKVIGLIGDNLGQHEIGGFCENFSTNLYPCRYCYTTKENLTKFDYRVKNPRTINDHINDINHLETHDFTIIHKGVKSDSILNKLQHFHICQPGLAPCIAHDIFEGVLQYDLIMLIHYFSVSKENFYDYLNMSYASLSKILKFAKQLTGKSIKQIFAQNKESNEHLVMMQCLLTHFKEDQSCIFKQYKVRILLVL